MRGRHRVLRATACALVLAAVACGGNAAEDEARPSREKTAQAPPASARPPSEVERLRGEAVLLPLKRDLLGALSDAMQQGGAPAAISVCRDVAPRLAAEHSRDGVEVGRTSHRLRNRANEARPWMQPLLADFAANPARAAAAVVELGPDRIGYVEPIRVNELCLACHGSTIDPAIAKQLAANYPEDSAVGFQLGDFRGLFWAEFPRN